MTSWFIYWMIIIGRLHELFIAAAILSAFAILTWELVVIVECANNDDKEYANKKKLLPVKFSFIILLFIILAVLTPKLDEIAAIYLIPKMVNNESIQEIPEKALDLLEIQIDKWIANAKRSD